MMLGRMERMSQDAPKRGQLLMRDQHGLGLDWSSPCRLVLSLGKEQQRRKERKMRRGEPGETAGRRGSGGAASFEAAPAIW